MGYGVGLLNRTRLDAFIRRSDRGNRDQKYEKEGRVLDLWGEVAEWENVLGSVGGGSRVGNCGK